MKNICNTIIKGAEHDTNWTRFKKNITILVHFIEESIWKKENI